MDDVKKLIEIAEKPLKEPIKKTEESSSVYTFINEAKVRSHLTLMVQFSIIYQRYTKWCRNNNVRPKGTTVFARDFGKKFQRKFKGGVTYYYVSPEGFDLTSINLQEAEGLLQDVHNVKKEKTSKVKKERKTKSPKSISEPET